MIDKDVDFESVSSLVEKVMDRVENGEIGEMVIDGKTVSVEEIPIEDELYTVD